MIGTLFIIAAPSGAGKTSLVSRIVTTTPHVTVSVSHTTRPSRKSEQSGRNYHFVEPTDFSMMVADGVFLEHADVFGYRYGTSAEWVNTTLAAGQDVILEIDWQGAAIVREKMPACVSIFILPPALSVLEQRLRTRAQDDEAVIARRLQAAKQEMSHFDEFDYVIVNDDFDQAANELQMIIVSQRLRADKQKQQQHTLLAELLA